MENRKRPHIESIQTLRAIACMGILISHSGVKFLECLGKFGVSVFIVLSGFMMMYSYYGMNRIGDINVIDNIKFAWKRIKGLYPLHIITTLAMFVFVFIGGVSYPITISIISFITNLFLIQEWIPLSLKSINGVSWYLCVIVFCYFVFPYINKIFEKNYSRKKAYFSILILFIIQFLIGLIGQNFSDIDNIDNNVWTYDLTEWFVYMFPLSRVFEFIIGCNLGYLFLTKQIKTEEKHLDIHNFITICGMFLVVLANICFAWMHNTYNVIVYNSDLWWTYSIVFIPGTCIIVMLFADSKSTLSKMLTNRFLIYLGNISQYIFLIHFVVFRYIESILSKMISEEFYNSYGVFIQLTLGVGLTYLATIIWELLLSNKIKRVIA